MVEAGLELLTPWPARVALGVALLSLSSSGAAVDAALCAVFLLALAALTALATER